VERESLRAAALLRGVEMSAKTITESGGIV
jgi:hypothetical protein